MAAATRKPSPAFTLVELLVVISIIALLIALLLPALANTRRVTKRVLCATNLRQLGFGYANYAIDHKDLLPRNDIEWTGYPPSSWCTFSMFLLKTSLRDVLEKNYGLIKPMWDCPAAKFPVPSPDWPAPQVGPGYSVVTVAYSLWAGRTWGNWGLYTPLGFMPEDLPQKMSDRPKAKGGSTNVPWMNCHVMYAGAIDQWLTEPEYWAFSDPDVLHWRQGMNSLQPDCAVIFKTFNGQIVTDPNADPNIIKMLGPIPTAYWPAYWGY